MILNIGRQLGSGGREIGKRLAERLNMAYFDKELILLAAKESGICPEMFEQADECTSKTGGFFGLHFPWSTTLPYNSGLTNEVLFKIQSDVIRQQAEKQPCVFVGRCADYILRDRMDCVNIFISADEKDRIKRIAQHHQCDNRQAEELLRKTDKGRAAYYDFYTDKTWGAAPSYDLCINSSLLGIERTVDMIALLIQDFDIH